MSSRPSPVRIVGVHALGPERFDRPILDDDRLLWFGERWVAVTDLQTPVVEHLLAHLGQPVARDEIAEVYGAAGGSTQEAAVMSVMRRVARAFVAIGANVRFSSRSAAIVVSLPAPPARLTG